VATDSRAAALAAATATDRATGAQSWSLLWSSSRKLAAMVVGWVVASTLAPALVVVALGVVVARVPAAVAHGITSADGRKLVTALVVAGVIFGFSLVLDPVGAALATAARARVTGRLQARLLAAVSQPSGVAHLEDADVLDRLARAEGSLTGFFPGDAPVTWAGILGSRASGIVGCMVVAAVRWWLGLLLLVMWLLVRKIMLAAVIRQATDLRGQTASMRRAWYFAAVGTKARDAKEVRVFGLGDFLAEAFRAEHLEALRGGAGGLRDIHRRAVGCVVVVFLTYAIALTTIAEQARTHALDLRALATVLPMLAVTMSTGSVSFDDITLAWTLAGLPDVDRLEAQLIERRQQLQGAGAARGMPTRCVRFESVKFRYPTGSRDVLTEFDLELRTGTSTAIVGVNGAGKSTVVSLLSRLRDPTGGRITVDDVDVRELDAGRWQRTVAVMPQAPAHYPVSAYDNIAFGAIEHRDDRDGIEEAARKAGFLEVVDTLPDRWQTLLSRGLPGGVDLSGGQWQRLALARALFATRHGARLLVLDEPTAALDVRSEARFYGRFLEITQALTTLVISHRFATVRQANTICVLADGRIVERGSHDELVASGGQYARMYALQAARFGHRG
jgi:ATP-binding cassette, subfamily B, bacterial